MGAGTREVLRCLLEGLRWLWGAEAVRVAGKSGISQARTRLGAEPLCRLYERVVRPIATPATKGASYRMWRLVSLDGSCLDVADTEANCTAFGRPEASRGESAFPQLRFVTLVENGTHVLFGARLGSFADGETTLAHAALPALQPGMLCLADRYFFGYALWKAGRRDRCRPALARAAQHPPALRGALVGRVVSDQDLSEARHDGPGDRRGHPGAGDRVSVTGRSQKPELYRLVDDDPAIPQRHRRKSWRSCTWSDGSSRPRWTSSRRTCAGPAPCCAA